MQFGNSEDTFFYGFEAKEKPSSWINFPTEENPENKFKFISVEVSQNKDLIKHNRQTYSLLDWLGDCGGLLDALSLIGEIITYPFSVFALNAKLASLLVRYKPSKPGEKL